MQETEVPGRGVGSDAVFCQHANERLVVAEKLRAREVGRRAHQRVAHVPAERLVRTLASEHHLHASASGAREGELRRAGGRSDGLVEVPDDPRHLALELPRSEGDDHVLGAERSGGSCRVPVLIEGFAVRQPTSEGDGRTGERPE